MPLWLPLLLFLQPLPLFLEQKQQLWCVVFRRWSAVGYPFDLYTHKQLFHQADQYGTYVDTTCCNNSPMDGVVKYVAEPGCMAGYMCYMGKARYTVTCIEGMLYDESIGNCNWASVTQCISSCPGSNGIVVSPTPPPIAPPSCPVGTDNLGPQLSASDFTGEFGLLGVTNNLLSPVGRESQLSLLVGGNYDGPLAAEIEGRIVVLGDFKIGQNGVNSLGMFATMCCMNGIP